MCHIDHWLVPSLSCSFCNLKPGSAHAGMHPRFGQGLIKQKPFGSRTMGTANGNTLTLNGLDRGFWSTIQDYWIKPRISDCVIHFLRIQFPNAVHLQSFKKPNPHSPEPSYAGISAYDCKHHGKNSLAWHSVGNIISIQTISCHGLVSQAPAIMRNKVDFPTSEGANQK